MTDCLCFRTEESLICRLELSGQAAEGGGQMEMVLMRVKTKGASDKAEWLNIMPEKESISDPDLDILHSPDRGAVRHYSSKMAFTCS